MAMFGGPMGGPMGGATPPVVPPMTPPQPGAPPGGTAGLLGLLGGPPPGSEGDTNAALRTALAGITQLSDAIKGNPAMIEILASVMKSHPTLRLIWLAASRHPEIRQRLAEPETPKVAPIIGA